MLARSRALRHPSGGLLETPLLVPSFSSKGFGFDSEGVSVVTKAIRATGEVLTECMLVSAYDIFHKHIPEPDALPSPEIVFVDSGGYETANDHDMSAVFRHPGPKEEWDEPLLQSVLDAWPSHIPAVFVSFDHSSFTRSVVEQVEAARKLFARYPTQAHAVIIKSEKKNEVTFKSTLQAIGNNIDQFAQFAVLGVSEKELGNSALLRMLNIAKIRLALDDEDINVPIQVFGSLDPVSSCLYFLAGAEIFDGLTWLRYSYLNGTAVYNSNYGALCVGIHERDSLVQAKAFAENIYYLRRLQYEMKDFLQEEDFGKFIYHSEFLKKAYGTLRTKLKGRI